MSELKAKHVVDVYDEYSANPYKENQVYLKSEADKVIANLKNEIEEQKRLRDMALASVPNVLKVMKIIQHHKYKRCLAMAMWCHNQREIYERDSYDWELEDDAKDSLRNKANIMRKWRKRWLKISEKFKTNSTAQ